LLKQLTTSAKRHERSLTTDVVDRLEASFRMDEREKLAEERENRALKLLGEIIRQDPVALAAMEALGQRLEQTRSKARTILDTEDDNEGQHPQARPK
jgi:hypothetical protein